MFGDMHDAVIGRGSLWVKDLRVLGYKPGFCNSMFPYIFYALQVALSIKLIVAMELF
jgi:hypothetical protein